jgi:hypothetical protein
MGSLVSDDAMDPLLSRLLPIRLWERRLSFFLPRASYAGQAMPGSKQASAIAIASLELAELLFLTRNRESVILWPYSCRI